MRNYRGLLSGVIPLVVWTALIWVSRIRNIWADDNLSDLDRTVSTLVAAVFVTLAVVAAVVLWRSRQGGPGRAGSGFLVGFAAWTIGYWIIRSVEILLDDHSGAFKAVHTALALVSCVLAAVAWRAVSRAGHTDDRVLVEAQR